MATSIDGGGWYAEFRIPFNTLRYGADNAAWGFNLTRRVRRLNEESFWSPVPREFNLYRLNYAGDLEGLEPPFRRLGTVTPYGFTSTARNYEAGETSFDEDAEFGGEAKLQITRGLTLDMTVNTDFAQVEVDDQQTNLTRFSLLFPEKRPFFLENAGFFTVGAGGADLFFSRRIGIADGEQVPIKGGGRLSGKVAGLNVGLLHIQTDGVTGRSTDNAYSVAPVARELPNRSRVGALFVDRSGDASGDYNRTFAAEVTEDHLEPAFFTDPDTLLDGSEVSERWVRGAEVAIVRIVDRAPVLGGDLGELDHFFRARVTPGQIEEPGRESVGTLVHALSNERSHPVELGGGRCSIFHAENCSARGVVPD